MPDYTKFANYKEAITRIDEAKEILAYLDDNVCKYRMTSYLWANNDWHKCNIYSVIRRLFSRKFGTKCIFSNELLYKVCAVVKRKFTISTGDLLVFLAANIKHVCDFSIGQSIYCYNVKYVPLKTCKITANCKLEPYKKEDYAIYRLNVDLTQADIKSFEDEELFFREAVGDIRAFTFVIINILADERRPICFRGHYKTHPLLDVLRHIFAPNVCEPGQRARYLRMPILQFYNCGDHISLYSRHRKCYSAVMTLDLAKAEPLSAERIAKLAQWFVYNMARTLRYVR